jgi:hypothetical protein
LLTTVPKNLFAVCPDYLELMCTASHYEKAVIPCAVSSLARKTEGYLAPCGDFPANDEASEERNFSKGAVAQLLQEVDRQRATTAYSRTGE